MKTFDWAFKQILNGNVANMDGISPDVALCWAKDMTEKFKNNNYEEFGLKNKIVYFDGIENVLKISDNN